MENITVLSDEEDPPGDPELKRKRNDVDKIASDSSSSSSSSSSAKRRKKKMMAKKGDAGKVSDDKGKQVGAAAAALLLTKGGSSIQIEITDQEEASTNEKSESPSATPATSHVPAPEIVTDGLIE